jgi:rhamnulokinase
MVRSILESLARAFADAIATAASLSGKPVSTVHLVGGGALNELLCQLTADRTGLTVIAGPVEATAIGNVLVQARTCGMLSGDVDALRAVVADSVSVRLFQPAPRRAR